MKHTKTRIYLLDCFDFDLKHFWDAFLIIKQRYQKFVHRQLIYVRLFFRRGIKSRIFAAHVKKNVLFWLWAYYHLPKLSPPQKIRPYKKFLSEKIPRSALRLGTWKRNRRNYSVQWRGRCLWRSAVNHRIPDHDEITWWSFRAPPFSIILMKM